jgi:Tol biopolymer transport system component
MSTRPDFDLLLAGWIEDGPIDVPAHVVEDALAQARLIRQRRDPISLGWRDFMDTVSTLIPAPARTSWLRAAIVAVLVTIALVAAALFAGSQTRVPKPFGLAEPGLIAFDSDGAIVVANADGTGRRTLATGTPDLSPTFSPDGKWIAFWARNRYVSDSTFHLNVMTVDGTETRFMGGRFSWEVWSAHEIALPAITWAPDSRRLVYSDGRRTFVVERDKAYALDDLAAGWQSTDPIGDPNRDAMDPQWSPDGTQIAFRSDDGVYVMNADGMNVHRISRAAGNEFAFMRPQWQPGGSLIAYYAGDPSSIGGEHDIYVASADGATEVRLTTEPADEFFPAWSPDGTRLAFDRVVDGATARIVIVDQDGAHPIVSAPQPLDGVPPIWSPDGKSLLAFVASSAGRSGLTRLAAADGTPEGLVDITNSAGDASWQRVAP